MSIAPWHMWGTNVNATLTLPQHVAETGQLARAEYHRPESWRFLLYARILRSQIAVPPASVVVAFSCAQGVGRANVQVPAFEKYIFQITTPGEQGATNPKFSTQVVGPDRSDTAPAGTTGSIVDTIVAQDIQIGYQLIFVTATVGDQVQIEVGAAIAPWHHARPDWMLHHFRGEELEGR